MPLAELLVAGEQLVDILLVDQNAAEAKAVHLVTPFFLRLSVGSRLPVSSM
ncbi:hypothetical protein [Aminobacter sp. MDW-2]|uniref:hypothetical protein n=1 Tax=Aminobacter sp. MDW-2 TaxID=2666139 RepID=UPI00163C61AE|nr:hypothetical protein H5P29_31480 [Aminobacter sp. MDW-2]